MEVMEQEKNLNKDEPVMVLKYSIPRTALFVFIFLPFSLTFLLGGLKTINEPPEDWSTFDRYFVPYGLIILGLMGIWLVVDLLNTKQIEVYNDRIVKRVRISFLTQRNRVIYYDRIVDGGIWWIGIIFKERWRWGLWVYTSRLKKEDEMRFYEFLSQISGRPKEFFMYRPIYMRGFKKLIKEESYGTNKQ
jgi:hypothetical protein